MVLHPRYYHNGKIFLGRITEIELILCCYSGKPEYEIMQTAWRERNPGARIKAAKEAIVLNPECATAYILLAEEEVNYQ